MNSHSRKEEKEVEYNQGWVNVHLQKTYGKRNNLNDVKRKQEAISRSWGISHIKRAYFWDKLMALHKEKETEIEKERTKERRNYPILRQSI